MEYYEYNGQKMAFIRRGDGEQTYLWCHGWGTRHESMLPLAETAQLPGRHFFLDFPGFGQSPMPDRSWNLDDYVAIAKAFLEDVAGGGGCVWVAHSFSGRIGIKLAVEQPQLIDKLIFVGAHGLKPVRPFWDEFQRQFKVRLYKTLKHLVWNEDQLNKLRTKFGSADYKNAGPEFRGTFLNIVSSHLDEIVPRVSCPILLIYGDKDGETPPNMGQRYHQMIKDSELHILPQQDHYSILQDGRHVVAKIIREFV